jgi:predicted MFS family arabinose efflux permease
MYVNSSYLEQYFSAQVVSIFYIIGSLCMLAGFFLTPKLIKCIGVVRTITYFTLVEFVALILLALSTNPSHAAILFIVHFTIVPLILFSLDTLMEGLIGSDESGTGSKRGLVLTLGGLALALAALSMGEIIGSGTPRFSAIYIAGALLLIPFMSLLIWNFRKYKDPVYEKTHAILSLRAFWHKKDIRNVFFAHLLLQVFFSWLVMYNTTYLTAVIGYSWETVGFLLSIAMLAYVIFEYPVGRLADLYFGEKEMMAIGFMVMAISIACFQILDDSSFILWAIVLFMTRTGAALVETTTESYFFKHTKGKDAGFVGIFRIAQPLGYIIGPILGGISLFYFQFSFIFVIFGLCMVPGLFFAMALHDTR